MSRDVRAGLQLGHFEILEPLGAGGMGQVWRARDLQLKRDVAVKLLPDRLASDADAMLRFRREAELMAAVEHPNVASIFAIEQADVGDHEATFLVMELVEGATLADRLGEGPLDVGDARQIGSQIAGALQAAHERGVVHRDLKPANVMLGPRGRVKVLDFGIAKAVGASGTSDLTNTPTAFDATATGTLIGTAPYMSPEQVRGRDVDARTDVWALGCLLFEMLTGERAFDGDTPGDVLGAVLSDEPRWDALPDGLPPAVAKLVRGCLHKDVEQRAWTAAEARRALEAAPTGGVAAPARRVARDRPAWLLPATVILVAAVAWLWGGRDPGDGAPGTPSGNRTLEEVASIVALPATLEGELDEVFGGAHEGLTDYVSGIEGLVVKQPPSAAQLAGLPQDSRSLGSQLRADALLRTWVSSTADGVALRVRLIDPQTDGVIWGEQFLMADAGPPELIRRAGSAVRRTLRPESAPAGPRQIASTSDEAMAQLNLGASYANAYNFGHDDDDLERAQRALQAALDLDSGLGDAAAWLSYLGQYRWEGGDAAAVADIGRWAELAVQLDDESGLAWVALSNWRLHETGDPATMLTSGLRGAALAPESAVAQFGVAFALTPSVELARAAMMRAFELDPLHLFVRNGIATLETGVGAPVETTRPHLEYIRRMQPENVQFSLLWLRAMIRAGDAEGIRREGETIRRLRDQLPPGYSEATRR